MLVVLEQKGELASKSEDDDPRTDISKPKAVVSGVVHTVSTLIKNENPKEECQTMNLGKEYLKVVQERFNNVKDLGDKTMRQLSNEEIHWSLNEASNSVAIIVKHVSGNMMSRWSDFLTSDGEKSYRNRDGEFEKDTTSKQELIRAWEKGWNTLFETLKALGEKDLLKSVYIRGESHSVLEAIERQMAHYAYHVGQIVYIGKQIKGEDWETLSIPKGKSEEYLQKMLKKNS